MINTPIDIIPDNPITGNNWKEDDRMKNLNLQTISRLGTPITLIPGQATLEDIYIHATLRQRLNPNTAKKRINTLEYISNHTIPIDLANPTLQDWINHSDYREQIEGATTALQNEWKAIKTLLTAYGLPHWNYIPPTTTTHNMRTIQHPDRIKQMIHHTYTKDKNKNKHIQYLITATYMIGLRNPSETCKLTLQDINLENGTIIITEPKKGNRKRQIKPPQQFMTGRNCKSLRYWIDYTRNYYTTSQSKNYLFITLNGKPFTPNYLRKYLSDQIKPHYPEYQPYLCRHWCATAKLIQEYITTKHWNKHKVANYLGHETDNTTDTYISQAETWYEIAPYDWFSHVLKHNAKNKRSGENHAWEHNYKEKQIADLWGFERTQQKEILTSETTIFMSGGLWPSSFFYFFHHDRDDFEDFLVHPIPNLDGHSCPLPSSYTSEITIQNTHSPIIFYISDDDITETGTFFEIDLPSYYINDGFSITSEADKAYSSFFLMDHVPGVDKRMCLVSISSQHNMEGLL